MTAQQTPPVPEAAVHNLNDPEFYINRELSILAFNLRVLEQALDEVHPLLERLGFLRIFSSNLDEFFEIRVAGLKRQLSLGRAVPGPDGMLPKELLTRISDLCHDAVDRQYRILNEILLPAMAQENIRFLKREEWTDKQANWVKKYFREQVYPVLTPIGLDPAHPFPKVVNKSLNFIVSLEGKDAFGRALNFAIVPAPRSLPRMIRLPADTGSGGDDYVFLSSIIHEHAHELFPGMTVQGCYQFRVTRNADLALDEVEAEADLAVALKDELFSRRYGDAVRLEVADNCPRHLVDYLLKKYGLNEEFLYRVNGPVNLVRLITDIDRPRLRYLPMTPAMPERLAHAENYFEVIAQGDVLLNHPFESFAPVVEFLRQAARDPNVLAIKQTLYRTGKNSEIVNLLSEAARNGKEVTAVIELRARFDEESNIEVAAKLQEAGAIVVYGIVGYKTHAKMLLVVRREGKKLKRYVHMGTGNYHAVTARIYTDFSLITAEEELCEDVHKVFQELTGMGKLAKLKKLLHAPFTLHARLMEHIEHEIRNAKEGKPAHIMVRTNSVTEKNLIQALYRASQAGVKVDLIVRGICCLRPGIPGVSENIRVRSVIGRFLEHSRVFWFENGGENIIYCSSADWMDRNMFFRVETCFPITDPELAKRVKHDALLIYLADNRQSWQLQSDGSYRQISADPGKEKVAQQILLDRLAQH
jgi:polyphosphate kinase